MKPASKRFGDNVAGKRQGWKRRDEYSQPVHVALLQRPNWNDLRYLLAIQRGQTLRAAAQLLRMDDAGHHQ